MSYWKKHNRGVSKALSGALWVLPSSQRGLTDFCMVRVRYTISKLLFGQWWGLVWEHVLMQGHMPVLICKRFLMPRMRIPSLHFS